MLNKEITYHGFDGETYTEVFHFNLTETEVIRLQTSYPGGLTGMIERIAAAKDGKEIINVLELFIKACYGKKSPDGKRLDKSDAAWREFYDSDAYNQLFLEIAFDADAAARFFNAVIPQDSSVKIPTDSGVVPIGTPSIVPSST